MTPRDIFLNTLNFQPVSRLPRVEWAAWWDKTIARWENEGLPKGLSFEDSLRYFGLDVMQCLMAQAGKASIHNEEEYEAVRGELYEIVPIPQGKETMICQLLRQPQKDAGKRIVVVEDTAKIELLHIPQVAGFCTVAEDGTVSYYKKEAALES